MGLFKALKPSGMSGSAKYNTTRTGLGTVNMASAHFTSLDNYSKDVEFMYLSLELSEKVFTEK